MSKTQGYIIIRQALLATISKQQTEEAIAKAYPEVTRATFEHVEIASVTNKIIPHTALKQIQWQAEARQHHQIVEQQLKPLLQEYPDYEVVYFGAAPVALATYLGSLLGTWTKVSIFLLNHKGEKEWYQQDPTGYDKAVMKLKLEEKGIPKEENNTTEDISITVATSYTIDRQEVQEAIASNLAKQLVLSLNPMVLDLPNASSVSAIGDKFGEVLNQVANNLPQIETIHLIAGVPVPLAFLMGTKISANIQPNIQLYQYVKGEDVPYLPVLKIGQALQEALVLSAEQKETVVAQRKKFEVEEWGNLQDWISIQEGKEKEDNQDYWINTWPKELKKAKEYFNYYFWKDLPAVYETPLWESKFSMEENILIDFDFDEEEETWAVGDILWYRIRKALKEDEKQLFRSIRLFVFHEAMHYWKHDLKGVTAEGIGRFPKILERADYQSDVWAMWQEYLYSDLAHPKDIDKEKPSKFFLQLVDNALATMWAFDETGGELNEMQIRRVNRYLIWYWQRLRLEDKRCKSLADIAEVLAEMPVLELKGLPTKIEGPRVFYQFDRLHESTRTNNKLEFGVLWSNKICRRGSVDYFNIPDLVQAFKKRSSREILQLLKAFYSSVV